MSKCFVLVSILSFILAYYPLMSSAQCPTTDNTDTTEELCSGDIPNLPTLNLEEDNGNEVEWFEGDADSGTPFADIVFTNESCSEITIKLTAWILCDEDEDEDTPDTYVELDVEHEVEVYPGPFLLTAVEGACGEAAIVIVLSGEGSECDAALGEVPEAPACDSGITNEAPLEYAQVFFEGTACEQIFDELVLANCEAVPCEELGCPTVISEANDIQTYCGVDDTNLENIGLEYDIPAEPALVNVGFYFTEGDIPTDEYEVGSLSSASACESSTTEIFVYLECDLNGDGFEGGEDDSYIAAGSISVEVYPDLSDMELIVNNAGACCPSIEFECAGVDGFIIGNDLDANGATPDCSSIIEAGVVGFSIINTNVLSDLVGTSCYFVSIPVPYECEPAPCPFSESENSSEIICEGDVASLPILDIVDDNGEAVQWFTDVSSPSNPTEEYTDEAIDYPVNGDACSPEDIVMHAYIPCDTDNDGLFEQLTELGITHTVTVYPNISVTVDSNDDGACVIEDCGYEVVYDVISDGTSDGEAGVNNCFECTPPEVGTVTFVITDPDEDRPALCNNEVIEVNFNCSPDPVCGELIQSANGTQYFCGIDATDLSNEAIGINYSAPGGGAITTLGFYLTQGNPPEDPFVSGSLEATDLCQALSETVYVYLECDLDGDGFDGGADDSFEFGGSFEVEVYPNMSDWNLTIVDEGACGPCITAIDCEDELDLTISNTYDDNGACPAYEINTGLGPIEFTIIRDDMPSALEGEACAILSLELPYICEACPSVIGATNSSEELCGSDTPNLPDLSLNFDNGNEVEWFEGDPTDGGTSFEDIDFNNLGCSIAIYNLDAWILCDDDLDEATPLVYQSLGASHLIESYPETFNLVINEGGCNIAPSYQILAADESICAADEGIGPGIPPCDTSITNSSALEYDWSFFEGSSCAQSFNGFITATCESVECACPSTEDVQTEEDIICGAAVPAFPTLNLENFNDNEIEWQADFFVNDPNNPLVPFETNQELSWTIPTDSCNFANVEFHAWILCDDDSDPDTEEVLVDLEYIHTTTIYPPLLEVIDVISDNCVVQINECGFDVNYSVSSNGATDGATGTGGAILVEPEEEGTVFFEFLNIDLPEELDGTACALQTYQLPFTCVEECDLEISTNTLLLTCTEDGLIELPILISNLIGDYELSIPGILDIEGGLGEVPVISLEPGSVYTLTVVGETDNGVCATFWDLDLSSYTCNGVDPGLPPLDYNDCELNANANVACNQEGGLSLFVNISEGFGPFQVYTNIGDIQITDFGTQELDFEIPQDTELDIQIQDWGFFDPTGCNATFIIEAIDICNTCEGVDAGLQPATIDECNLDVEYELLCQADGNVTLVYNVTDGSSYTSVWPDQDYYPVYIDDTLVDVGEGGENELELIIGENYNIEIIDPCSTNQCVWELSINLSTLSCEDVEAGDPPIPTETDCELEANAEVICDGEGEYSINIAINGGTGPFEVATESAVIAEYTSTGNYQLDNALLLTEETDIIITDLGVLGNCQLTFEDAIAYDVCFTCIGVAEGFPPLALGNCDINVSIDTDNLICDEDGEVAFDLIVNGSASISILNGTTAISEAYYPISINGENEGFLPEGGGNLSLPTGEFYIIEIIDPCTDECSQSVILDLSILSCEDVDPGDPPVEEDNACIFDATLINAFLCNNEEEINISLQITNGYGPYEISYENESFETTATFNVLSVAPNAVYNITIVDLGYEGLFDCEESYVVDLTDLSCYGVDPGTLPIPSDECTLTANFDPNPLCNADGNLDFFSDILTGIGPFEVNVNGEIITFPTTAAISVEVPITADDYVITISDLSYTGDNDCSITYSLAINDLSCEGIEAGDPPILTDSCELIAIIDDDPLCSTEGNLLYTIEVLDGLGPFEADVNGVITSSNNIGEFTVEVPLVGEEAVIVVTDITYSGPDDCSQSFTLDISNFICEGVEGGDPPINTNTCTLEADLILNPICNEEGNLNYDVEIMAGIGPFEIDANGDITTTNNLGTTTIELSLEVDFYAIIVKDLSYTGVGSCALPFVLDVSDFSCDGVEPGDPPILTGDCLLEASIDPEPLCNAEGNLNFFGSISSGIGPFEITLNGAFYDTVTDLGDIVINSPIDQDEVNILITDLSFSGAGNCEYFFDVELEIGLTCEGIEVGAPPIVLEPCTLNADFYADDLICTEEGQISFVIEYSGGVGPIVLTLNEVFEQELQSGENTISLAEGQAYEIAVVDFGYTGTGICDQNFDIDLTELTCIEVEAGDPPVEVIGCPLLSDLLTDNLYCTNDGLVGAIVFINGGAGPFEIYVDDELYGEGEVGVNPVELSPDQLYEITVLDTGAFDEDCEMIYELDLEGLTCETVAPNDPPISLTDVCTLEAASSETLLCDGNDNILFEIEITEGHGPFTIDTPNGDINGEIGINQIPLLGGDIYTIELTDEGYTGDGDCSLEFEVDLDILSCSNVEEGEEPISTANCILDANIIEEFTCNADGQINFNVNIESGFGPFVITVAGVGGFGGELGPNEISLAGMEAYNIVILDEGVTSKNPCLIELPIDLSALSCEGVPTGGSPNCALSASINESATQCLDPSDNQFLVELIVEGFSGDTLIIRDDTVQVADTYELVLNLGVINSIDIIDPSGLGDCEYTLLYEATLAPDPELLNPLLETCSNSENVIYNLSTEYEYNTYNWEVTGGEIIDGGGEADDFITVNWGSGFSGLIELNALDQYNCEHNLIEAVTLTSADPALADENEQVCYHYRVVRYDIEGEFDNYDWEVIGGSIVEGGGENSNFASIEWEDEGGTLAVNVTDDEGCQGSVFLNVYVTEAIEYLLTEDQEICEGDEVLIEAQGGQAYSWSPSFIFEDNGLPLQILEPDTSSYYTVNIFDEFDCYVSDSVRVEVIECRPYFFVPNVFTPNNDGINDTWQMDFILDFPNNEVLIFNRWGQLLYQEENYINNWDGTSNEGELPEGTYYYIIDLKNNDDPLMGDVTIFRGNE